MTESQVDAAQERVTEAAEAVRAAEARLSEALADQQAAHRRLYGAHLAENGRKPVRVTAKGLLIDGEPFPYPIEEGSISVRREHKRNLLTMTLLVGEVTMDPRRSSPPDLVVADGEGKQVIVVEELNQHCDAAQSCCTPLPDDDAPIVGSNFTLEQHQAAGPAVR